MRTLITSSLLLITSFLGATEYAPWFGRMYEIEARVKGLYANYVSVQGVSENEFFDHNHDLFLDGSLSTSYCDMYNGEIEFGASNTVLHSLEPNYASITGRVLLFDDVLGDPISMTSGLTLRGVWTHALKDFLPQHHGRAEAEIHIAVGKEVSCESNWVYRYWGMLGVGYAMDKGGAPWIHAKLQLDEKIGSCFIATCFCRSLMGCGTHNLDVWDFYVRNIEWNRIRHIGVDLGVKVSFLAEDYAILSLEYAHRLYAKNAPMNVNFIELKFVYPFGL